MSGFLAKTGLDSIKVGSHKVPIALIGGAAALAGVILVLRARSKGSPVATVGAVGQAPATAADTGFGNFGPDFTGALANITQQLTNLSHVPAVNGAPVSSAAALQGDYSTHFGPTFMSQMGNQVEALFVPGDFGAQFGGIFANGLQPTDVYGFIRQLYAAEGLAPPPTSGEFIYGLPGGGTAKTPFWASGSGPAAPTAPVIIGNPIQG